jgi:outer membrane receptor protein involved in Fe transport
MADLPASITALDRAEIQALAVQHFEELTRWVPNLNWSGEGSRARYFQLRGIGELEQYEGAPNPAVGFIIDDIDFSGIGGAATLFDTDRVEVLRGPQGTRFGANALAGLVYLQSAEPTLATSADVEATAGDDDTLALGGAVGGAIPGSGDTLSYRAALQSYESDGFRDNKFKNTDNTYKRDEITARLKLRWQPGETWQVDLTGLYLDLDNGYDAFAVDNDFDTFSDKPGKDAQETWAGSLRVETELGGTARFLSISSGALADIDFSFDADWGNDAFWNDPRFGNSVYDYFSSTDRDRKQFTQEFRLVSGPEGRLLGDRGDWVIGAYWQHEDEDNDIQNFARDDFTPGPTPGAECFPPYDTLVTDPPARCRQDFDSDYEADRYAVFGQLDLALAERVDLGIGLRLERREADYDDSNSERFSPDDNLWGGDVTLSYQFTDNTRGYGRVARGYRAGGFNINPQIPDGQVQFDDEHLWNYEAGLRSEAADGRWSVGLTLFWQERRDMQVKIPAQDVAGNPIAFAFFTDNAAEGHNAGAELEGRVALTDTISLRGMLGLLDTEVEEFAVDPALEGREQAHAPDYSFAVGASWNSPRGWFLDVDVTGMDKFYFDFSHDQQSDAYELLNLRAGREWGPWSLSAWVRNLTDKNYAVRGFYFENEPPDFPTREYIRLGDPRHVGVTLRYQL